VVQSLLRVVRGVEQELRVREGAGRDSLLRRRVRENRQGLLVNPATERSIWRCVAQTRCLASCSALSVGWSYVTSGAGPRVGQ
jgi:hypothetical protein